ncbi:hypothetical protein BS50DRAFT_623039 [Corynespora cassiicola Philippines]|uniref:Uncharacterized protein n=1 Tax=Corynespora cassiicola Philippines TaxID=1448308 RepID=A0A2T2NGB4_CORCC|nr:hypothetical protein BS50DRAFT_623039 [Corynespora cassiicola Philippines]
MAQNEAKKVKTTRAERALRQEGYADPTARPDRCRTGRYRVPLPQRPPTVDCAPREGKEAGANPSAKEDTGRLPRNDQGRGGHKLEFAHPVTEHSRYGGRGKKTPHWRRHTGECRHLRRQGPDWESAETKAR